MKSIKNRSFFKQSKWRYGGFAFAATAIIIAAVVLVNLGVSHLETKHGWRVDFSFNNLTSQSDTTRSVLKELSHPVHIYMLYTPGQEDTALVEILNRYQAGSPLVTYEMLELNKNPGLISKFQGDSETSLSYDSLIVYCEETGRHKILGMSSFASIGYSIESGDYVLEAAYEKRITESLLYVTRGEIPEIMLLTGHGEIGGDDAGELVQVLESNNYAVRSVNLRAGDTLTPGALLMILAPQKDFSGEEMEAVSAFAKSGGALFITCDFTDDLTGMDNYMSLLRSYGMIPMDGVVVASSEEAGTYFSGSQLNIIPYMLSGEATDSLRQADMSSLILVGARAFESPQEAVSGLTVSTVLASGYKAYLRDVSGGTLTLAQQEDDKIGPFSLALLSNRTQEDGTLSRAFILGSSPLLVNSSYFQISYNLEFLLRMCEHLLNQAPISLDIIAKPYLREGLKEAGQAPGMVVAVLLPLMVLVFSLFILLPRRHR